MNRTLIKTISLIAAFSVIVAFATGAMATYNSTSYLRNEIDEKIVAVTGEYANDFSADFSHMEGLTDSLAAYVTSTFDADGFRSAPVAYMDGYKEDLAEMIKGSLETIKSAHSLYVTFNPDLTGRNDEVWYIVREDGQAEEIIAVGADRDYELPYEEDMAYYFRPQEEDAGVWTSSYYDEDIEEEVFSYSVAVYVDDLFIGVAGADINAADMARVIREMSLYDGGRSALLDENHKFIIRSDKESGDEEKAIAEALTEEKKVSPESRSGIVRYFFDGEEKILSYSRLLNGWIFITTQPADTVYHPLESVMKTMVLMGVLLAVVLVAFLIALIRPLVKKTSTLEEENRKLEILTIYQSRQAKIGEMVGNITHQWKQPLNTINLILANLLDSYRYGDLDEKRLEKSVHKVETIVGRMSETINDFSDFLKPTREKTDFCVAECVEGAISLMEESINLHRIRMDVRAETERKAHGYYNDTVHVIFNLLNNARDAIVQAQPDDRSIRVLISDEGEMLRISVFNTGDVIDHEDAIRIFEPYFTTKEDTGGTGLGLYISRQIVEDRLNGSISMENVEGGVKFDVLIPVAVEAQEEENERG